MVLTGPIEGHLTLNGVKTVLHTVYGPSRANNHKFRKWNVRDNLGSPHPDHDGKTGDSDREVDKLVQEIQVSVYVTAGNDKSFCNDVELMCNCKFYVDVHKVDS